MRERSLAPAFVRLASVPLAPPDSDADADLLNFARYVIETAEGGAL